MRTARALPLVAVLAVSSVAGAQGTLTPYQQLGRDLLRGLVETNTTYSAGSTTNAANALAARFRAAGFPSEDVKNGDAAQVAALLRMKREGFVPAGDFVLALTAGEEGGGGYNGMLWLLPPRSRSSARSS